MRKNLFAHDEKYRSPNSAGTKWIVSLYVIDIWCIVVASEVCAAASQVATGGVAVFGHRLSSKAVQCA
ncbi:hypothetical protein [Alloprevotella tannerae]